MKRRLLTAISIFALLPSSVASARQALPLLPQSLPPADTVQLADVRFTNVDLQLALVSLQGLVNAMPNRPSLYLYSQLDRTNANRWLPDYYRKTGAASSFDTTFNQSINGRIPRADSELLSLLSTLVHSSPYNSQIQGIAVIDVCDPRTACTHGGTSRYDYTLNAATNAAGVEKLLIIPAPLLAARLNGTSGPRLCGIPTDLSTDSPCESGSLLAGLTIKRDFRCRIDPLSGQRVCLGIPEMNTPHRAAWWSSVNFLQYQSDKALANVYYDSGAMLFDRDYLIAHKIHTFFWPNEDETDLKSPGSTYNAWSDLNGHLEHLLFHTPANIPVLGNWAVWESPGCPTNGCGLGEERGVRMGGAYGKYTLGLGFGGGYSYHSGVQPDESRLIQKRARQHLQYYPKTLDRTKVYVALAMVESGDTPYYAQSGFNSLQWGDPYRGHVPISYGLTTALRDLTPGLLQYYYETATENDYFTAGISGLGYMYALSDSALGPLGNSETGGYGARGVSGSMGVETVTKNRADIMREYFIKTADAMRDIDMDTLAISAHPRIAASTDFAEVQQYIIPNLRTESAPANARGVITISMDFGRLPNVTSDSAADLNIGVRANTFIGGDPPGAPLISVHRTLTKWWQDCDAGMSSVALGRCMSHYEHSYPPAYPALEQRQAWGSGSLEPTDKAFNDAAAVTWMVREIQRAASPDSCYVTPYSVSSPSIPPRTWDDPPASGCATRTGNKFIHATALSWAYGPRRLAQVKNILEPQGYVFVTVDELDKLWREYVYYPAPPANAWGKNTGGFCSHPGSQLVRGDVNNDGVPDEICHDWVGSWWTQRRQLPALGPPVSGTELNSLAGWCGGTLDARIYNGEWNGDGRADFMCWSAGWVGPRTVEPQVLLGTAPWQRYFAKSNSGGSYIRLDNSSQMPFWQNWCAGHQARVELTPYPRVNDWINQPLSAYSPSRAICFDQSGSSSDTWETNVP